MNRLEIVGRIMSIGAKASGKSSEAKKEAIDEAIKEMNDYENAVKNCSIPLVSDQRELLIAFKNWEVDNDIKNLLPEQVVDFYIDESNS